MTKYIRTFQDEIVEVMETEEDISTLFHPSLNWEVCEQPDAKEGYVRQGEVWVDPSTIKNIPVMATEERIWRDAELIRADAELNKVQDVDPRAKGTVEEWRGYRNSLRNLTENPDFPNKSARPIPPDA